MRQKSNQLSTHPSSPEGSRAQYGDWFDYAVGDGDGSGGGDRGQRFVGAEMMEKLVGSSRHFFGRILLDHFEYEPWRLDRVGDGGDGGDGRDAGVRVPPHRVPRHQQLLVHVQLGLAEVGKVGGALLLRLLLHTDLLVLLGQHLHGTGPGRFRKAS